MTAKTARILLKIAPVIEATIPRVAKPTGCEDHEELIQDTIASAAEMLQSVEKAGKKAIPKSIVFYAINGPEAAAAPTSAPKTTSCHRCSAPSMRIAFHTWTSHCRRRQNI